MDTTFKGKYYNGTSSRSYPCEVELERRSIVIRVLDENEVVSEIIDWECSQILRDDIELNSKVRLRYGDSIPFQTLEVQGKQFLKSLRERYPAYSFIKRDFVAIISKDWVLVLAMLALLAGFGVFAFKFIIPGMAEYAATKVPLSVEQTIGESAYSQVTAFSSEDKIQSHLLSDFFKELKLEHTYDYTITVLNSEAVNAFAMPGGRIAVYSGIIDAITKPEELAALLAHESSHVELQHSLRSIFRALSGYFVISLVFGDMGGVTAVVFENMNFLQNLQYSREMEKEADMRGLKCMQQAGINPQGMIGLFHVIDKKVSSKIDESGLSEFASTHPLTKRRIEYIQSIIDADKQNYQQKAVLDSLFLLIKKQSKQ